MESASYVIRVPFAGTGAKARVPLIETVTADDLRQICDPIVDHAIEKIDEALEKAGITRDVVDLAILAGGSSQLPGVKDKIWDHLGVKPCEIPKDLMLAVSYGAALYQRDIFNLPKQHRDKRILGDSLGILVDDNGRKSEKLLLYQDVSLPAKASYTFAVGDGQELATINLIIMEPNHQTRNLRQRNLILSQSAREIKVDITVDENRMITVSAYDPDNAEERAVIQCDKQAIMNSAEIKAKQKKLGIVVKTGAHNSGLQDCVGIDLGTTTSELAHCNRTGEVTLEALENPEPIGDRDLAFSRYCFPSVVYYRDGMSNVEVANTAAVNAMGNDEHCFHTFKILNKFKPVGEVDGQPIMVQDLSASLLSKIWSSAQALPTPPSSAVITVPASFSFDECQDTYNAAQIAGIEHVTLIDEPTAAFYYYKHVQDIDPEEIRTVLVFDFGGGTTDVAILDVQRNSGIAGHKDNVYTVLSYAGDTRCGGRDVDQKMLELVQQRFEEKNGCKVSSTKMREPRKNVEKAKIALSEACQNSIME